MGILSRKLCTDEDLRSFRCTVSLGLIRGNLFFYVINETITKSSNEFMSSGTLHFINKE